MSAELADTVLHRKAQLGRDGFDAREMSPAKALRLALVKSAARLIDLVLTVQTVEQTSLAITAVEERLGNEGLLVLLDGPGQARAAVRFDLQVVAALIEMQLKGEVRKGEAPSRPVTQTDAAIALPVIDAMLSGFDASLEEAGIAGYPVGLRFADRMPDARSLALALSEEEFDHFRLMLDLGISAKTGCVDLILPRRKTEETAATTYGDKVVEKSVETNAMKASAVLHAVLGGVFAPLQDVCTWEPGALVPLAPEALKEAQLLAAGGQVVSHVTLGQLRGFRAVRLATRSDETPTHAEAFAQEAEPKPLKIQNEAQAPVLPPKSQVAATPDRGPSSDEPDLPTTSEDEVDALLAASMLPNPTA